MIYNIPVQDRTLKPSRDVSTRADINFSWDFRADGKFMARIVTAVEDTDLQR